MASHPYSSSQPIASLHSLAANSLSRVLFGFSKGVSFCIYIMLKYLFRYRRAVITKNLANAFPAKNMREIRALAKAYYRHMGDLVIEPFLFYLVSPKARSRMATYDNMHLLDKCYAEGKQVILFASHYGNWEFLINLPEFAEFDVYTAYSPVNNRLIDQAMLKIRSFLGVNLIPKRQFYRKGLSLLKTSDRPNLLVLIADQRPAPGNDKFHIPFLNQNTAVQLGAERMAISADTELLYIEAERTAQFRYRFTLRSMGENIGDAPMSITKAYYGMLEQNIRRAPAYWLWSHNRWKQASS